MSTCKQEGGTEPRITPAERWIWPVYWFMCHTYGMHCAWHVAILEQGLYVLSSLCCCISASLYHGMSTVHAMPGGRVLLPITCLYCLLVVHDTVVSVTSLLS